MGKSLTIGGKKVVPASKAGVKLRVTTDLNGEDVSLWIHAVRGVEAGPTLTLLSGLHGHEWLSVEIVRRAFEQADPAKMRGNLIVVPVANPVAFCAGARHTPDGSETPDLNRAFPGYWTWITEQLASSIVDNVLSTTDYLIDFHLGSWGTIMASVTYAQDLPDKEVVAKSDQMAKAYGYPCINRANVVTAFPGPRSAAAYASAKIGIPTIISEMGGVGFGKQQEEIWINRNLVGITNVMKLLGIIDGEQVLPDRYLVWEKRWRLNPSVAGYFHPLAEPEEIIMKEVQEGELLGRVLSPYTFEEVEALRSPGHGLVFYAATRKPIRPGFWAFGIVELDDPNCHWVARGE